MLKLTTAIHGEWEEKYNVFLSSPHLARRSLFHKMRIFLWNRMAHENSMSFHCGFELGPFPARRAFISMLKYRWLLNLIIRSPRTSSFLCPSCLPWTFNPPLCCPFLLILHPLSFPSIYSPPSISLLPFSSCTSSLFHSTHSAANKDKKLSSF